MDMFTLVAIVLFMNMPSLIAMVVFMNNPDLVAIMLFLNMPNLVAMVLSMVRICIGRSPKLPPGPFGFPIIGNILELGPNPHQSLAKLSRKYGPLMSLKLGSITTIVVSSPEMAKAVLQEHDVAFTRSVPTAVMYIGHDKLSVAWLPMDDQWRMLRRIMKQHMFSETKLTASRGLRRDKLQKLFHYVNECCDMGRPVDIGAAAFTTTLNLMSTTLFSIDFADFNSASSQEMKELMCHVLRCVGKPNLADYFPVLAPMDPQGISRELKIHTDKLLKIFEEMIDERLKHMNQPNDLLQALIFESGLPRDDIKHLLLDLFIAGTDTSASTVEWAMAELLHNPEKMSTLRDEIKHVLEEKGHVEESDMGRLPYLQAVVKETMRLHPPAPLLVPQKPKVDLHINGYLIPKHAHVLVNVWASSRDPNIWTEASVFMPERFLIGGMNYIGRDFKLIPFGAGRRICPGYLLAQKMMHLMLATLVGSFGWRGVNPNMDEKFGLTLHKAVPVEAVPVKI